MAFTNINYKDLDEETKKYINRAIDLYMAIKEKELSYFHKDTIDSEDRNLNQVDKKTYSFLLAIDSLSETTRKPFDDYGGFDTDSICEFVKLDKSAIKKKKPLSEEKYAEIFELEFSSLLMVYLGEYAKFGREVQKIRPEVILAALSTRGRVASEIVENYFSQHSRSFHLISADNPIYKALEAVCEKNNYVTYRSSNNKSNNDNANTGLPFLGGGLFSPLSPVITRPGLTKKVLEPEPKEKEKIDITDAEIWDYLDVLKGKFIGQEEFAEEIFYNIVNNIQLSRMQGVNAGRSIIFVDGPSGTGKTAITTDIAGVLGVPCVCSAITKFTASGYVGGDLEDLLKQLYEKSGNNLALAERGILIIDEFDKVAINGDRDLRMKQAVQDQLLSLLGGEKYTLSMGISLFGGPEVEFDTSKLTIICLGAITNLREEKTSNKPTIGFATEEKKEESSYIIKPEDLIKMGLQKELVGRINTFLHTKDYSIEDLEKILRISSISPIVGLKTWAEALGKSITIDDEVYPLIAEKAYDLNTGARSLQTVVNSIRTRFLKIVLREKEKDIHLGADDVNAAYAKTINRVKRG